MSELATRDEEREAVAEVVGALTDARLLTTSKDEQAQGQMVDVSHEALIRGWPRLRQWVEEDRAGLRTLLRLSEAAQEWQSEDRDEGLLYRGARLAVALEWKTRNEGKLSGLEREFLASSERFKAREDEKREADALKAIHIVEVIHRDIFKPENVMIQTDGFDFDIAKAVIVTVAGGGGDRPAAGDQTRLGATPRTLRYMSPEQARGEDLDARSDVFSLGLVLYEMIAGRHPYAGKSDEEIIEELKSEDEIPPVAEAQPRIPAALDRIVAKALRKNREERYPSSGEALADLEWLKSLIEVKSAKKERQSLRAKRADQLLTQFVVFHQADPKTLIPLGSLWTIHRFAKLKRGKLERELLRESLIRGLVGAGWMTLVVAAGTMLFAAWISVNETWEERILRDGHVAAVRRAVFSPDGRLLASGGVDRQVIVWDFARRERLVTLNEHPDMVVALAFSPDGKWLATGGGDRLIVWDTASWEKVTTMQFPKGRIEAVGFSPDGKLLAAALFSDNSTLLWRTGDWRQVGTIPTTVNEYTATLLFSPDSRRLIFARSDGVQPNVWDIGAGKPIGRAFELEWGGACGALSPDGAMLVNIDGYGYVKFIDLKRRRLLSRQQGHFYFARSAAFSPDGRLVATGSNDIALWETATQRLLAGLEHTDDVQSLAFSPDGQWLVSTHDDGAILVWDVAMRRRVANFSGHSGPVRKVFFSPDGKHLASGSDDQSVIIWDREDSRKQAVLTGQRDGIPDLIFSSQPSQITSVNAIGTIRLWDIANHRYQETPGLGTLDKEKYEFYKALAFSPDLRWATSPFAVWERASGRVVSDYRVITHDGDGISAAAFSRDGQRLAGVTRRGEVFLLETGTWQVLAQRKTPGLEAIRLSFSPDGKNLAIGDSNGPVWLWSINPLRQVAQLGRHDTHVEAVAFSPDGSRLASASDDQTICLWDVGTRKLIRRIGTHSSPVLSLTFSPDGQQIISGEQDHSVRLYTRRRALWGWRLD